MHEFFQIREADAQAALDALNQQARRINLDESNLKKGIGRLVLTLVELLRELLERQAIRRMEGGSLSDEKIEKLGNAFMLLAEQVQRLKVEFEITDEELNLDLGPLGKLL